MGNCIVTVDRRERGPYGVKRIDGTLKLSSSYSNAAGEGLNLSNEFKSSTVPTVILGSDDGYVLKATTGRNAEAGLVVAYDVGTVINGSYGPLSQVLNATDLSGVNIAFSASGQPY
tara:strand:- start:2280 stop:2627 length:348 start_codon:yes stop_codon:yes gene_type:complete